MSKAHDLFCKWRLTIFVALCLCLGGTSQYVTGLKLPLYYISAVTIGHAILTQTKPLKNQFSPSIILGGLLILLFLIYLVPLPPEIWAQLSGRELVVESFSITQNEPPWLPLSLSPRLTQESLFNFLPIIAVALIMTISENKTEIELTEKAIIILALASFFLGVLALAFNINIFSAYKFYTIGYPVGVFSNANHQASLSATVLPLAIYFLLKSHMSADYDKDILVIFWLILTILLILSLIIAGSIAGYFFLIINLFIGLAIMSSRRSYSFILFIPVAILVVFLVLDLFVFQQFTENLSSKFSPDSNTSRRVAYINSIEAGKSLGVFGAGPGSFDTIYRIFENPNALSQKYMNEAHNDYLQIWIELGVFGVIWLGSSLVWFLLKVKSCFLKISRGRKKQLIYCLCIATIVLHSIVDFPLRTIGISSVFTFLIIRLDRFNANTL